MTRQSHSFSVELAEAYGIECAILITHFQFWIEQNQAMGRNFHEERTWMYQTQAEIAAIYPYWSEDTIHRTIKKLVDEEVLIKGNFNKAAFDRTTWYAFKNEKKFTKPRNRGMEDANPRNGNREIALPIPDTNPDAYPDKQQQAAPAAAAAPSKKEKKKTIIYGCLESIDIPEKEKVWITHCYDEQIVQDAIDWATSPQTKISTTLVQAIKWACLNRPKMPKSKDEIIKENKDYSGFYLLKENKKARVDVLSKTVEVVFKGCQKEPFVISYEDKDFQEKLNKILHENGFKVVDKEVQDIFKMFNA